MKNRDNPRGLEPPVFALLTELRKVFGHVIGEWLIRWENWTVEVIDNGDDFELGQALGTIQGATMAWGEIITPPQADRLGKMAQAMADERVNRKRTKDEN